ncbi:hypothetical protein RHS01_09573 [Rhizoctonia solani]|uniref:Uncharacterized protein n=1 Tax=Rhizoctonia solani TaxID=456999 RepID=A0A8H7M0W1_9AGAM|nr:hypothetical protein RHS01_09573 [Rhizoctonia solani]
MSLTTVSSASFLNIPVFSDSDALLLRPLRLHEHGHGHGHGHGHRTLANANPPIMTPVPHALGTTLALPVRNPIAIILLIRYFKPTPSRRWASHIPPQITP